MTKIKIKRQDNKIKVKTAKPESDINKIKIKTITTREETVITVVETADGGTF